MAEGSITAGRTGGAAAHIETAAVRVARKAFKTPATKAPWIGVKEAKGSSAITAAAAAARAMRTIVDPLNALEGKGSGDVESSFVTYRALVRLKALAQEAARSDLSDRERAALQKAFARGMADLQSFMASAPSTLLTLSFGPTVSRVKSAPALPQQDITAVRGKGVSDTPDGPVAGLTGNEIMTIKLDGGGRHDTVSVDLSKLATRPPTLEQVAKAFTEAAAAANGSYDYAVRFAAAKIDGKYGLTMASSKGTTVSLQQANAGDALVVVSGQENGTTPGAADVQRFADTDGKLTRRPLGAITATDRAATAAAQEKAKAKASTDKSSEAKTALPTVPASLHAQGSVVAPDGFTYVVGTTSGDMGIYRSQGHEDMFLTKLDSEGKIVWQHGLGVTGTAQGGAVSVAPNGDIVVAGSVTGPFDGNRGDSRDMLVARYSASGEKLFSKSIASPGEDRATAIAVGGDGSIYLGGRVAGSSDSGGGAYVAHLNAAGKMIAQRTIESTGGNTLTALKLDTAGNLLALTRENGTARLRRIDATNLDRDLATVDLGKAEARAIAIGADGMIAVAGTTDAALPDNSDFGTGRQFDGFVTTLRRDLTGARTTYVGSGGADQIDGVAIMGGQIYVGGRTTSDLDGALRGKVDGFVGRIDAATGQIGSISQFGNYQRTVEPVIVSAALGGADGLGALGLHRGALNGEIATSLAAQFGLAAGDSFNVQLDGSAPRRVRIDANETMASLRFKVQQLLGNTTVSLFTSRNADGYSELTFSVAQGHTFSLSRGPANTDALAKLGIGPVRMHADPPPKKSDPKVKPGGSYGLRLTSTLGLTTKASANAAVDAIANAISMTQTAYRSLYWDDAKAARVSPVSAPSGRQAAQIASYKAALARLTSGGGSGGSLF